ncbi:MAG: DNA repair protein RecO [Pseudomonadota bacterium]
MDWRDEGILLSVRPHGETSAIIEVFTAEHGRHAGIVRGGVSRKLAPILQPGNQISVEWRARLEEHLGTFTVDLIQSRTAVMEDRARLAAMTSFCAMACYALPERQSVPMLYSASLDLAGHLVGHADWAAYYALWELALLEELGLGLDLATCAATGGVDDLIYVSPKSGRAVSSDAGAEYADRMLPLPPFFIGEPFAPINDVEAALVTTGFFLTKHLASQVLGKPLPPARDRLVASITRLSAGPL